MTSRFPLFVIKRYETSTENFLKMYALISSDGISSFDASGFSSPKVTTNSGWKFSKGLCAFALHHIRIQSLCQGLAKLLQGGQVILFLGEN